MSTEQTAPAVDDIEDLLHDIYEQEISIGDCLTLDPPSLLVEDMAHSLVGIDGPVWYMNPSFRVLVEERSACESVNQTMSLPHSCEKHGAKP